MACHICPATKWPRQDSGPGLLTLDPTCFCRQTLGWPPIHLIHQGRVHVHSMSLVLAELLG